MKPLLILCILLSFMACKKDTTEIIQPKPEPISDTFSILAGTTWFRASDNVTFDFFVDSYYVHRPEGIYVETYSLENYIITYQWITTIVNGQRTPPGNPETHIAKVKLIDNSLYFWHNYNTTSFYNNISTYTLGVKQ